MSGPYSFDYFSAFVCFLLSCVGACVGRGGWGGWGDGGTGAMLYMYIKQEIGICILGFIHFLYHTHLTYTRSCPKTLRRLPVLLQTSKVCLNPEP